MKRNYSLSWSEVLHSQFTSTDLDVTKEADEKKVGNRTESDKDLTYSVDCGIIINYHAFISYAVLKDTLKMSLSHNHTQ